MKISFLDIFGDTEAENYEKSTKHTRTIIMAGFILYSLFGILDIYALPETYINAWIIRYCIIDPMGIVLYFSTYSRWFSKQSNLLLSIIVSISQLGIICMIYLAKPNEAGYWGYYAGLNLITFWGSLIYRLSIPKITITTICNLLFYNILAIGFQRLSTHNTNSLEFGHLLINNFFLICSSFLAIFGAIQLTNYKKNLQNQNRLLNDEKQALQIVKESDKLKSSFLANMSHEIRTPMNAILGFSELLKKPTLTEKKRTEYLNIIQTKGNQLLHLINDIIDISRIEANYIIIKAESINVNALCEELLIVYKELFNKTGKTKSIKLIFQKSLPDNKTQILVDPYRLKQIISNLLDNALKFTSEGEIVFGFRIIENNTMQFYVKDTGIGISSENLSSIFERFRQLNNSDSDNVGGIGLGLNIVKRLVELMEGEISVVSNVGVGSEFYFTLPYKLPEDLDKIKPIISIKEINTKWPDKTILLAEDNDDNYKYLVELLNETAAKIVRAKNDKETLDIINTNDKIDLILMNFKMPLLNGYDVTTKIKSLKSGIPIIIQTSNAAQEEKNKLSELNCNDLISKPIKRDEILLLISKYLNLNQIDNRS